MDDLIKRIKCWLGLHEWQPSRYVRLGSTGATYHCRHCYKVEERG